MAEAFKKRFELPDETRIVPKAFVEVIELGDIKAMRGTYEPGWRWSESLKPIVGTESCEVAHLGIVVSGNMACRMDDGKEYVFHAGDAVSVPPGHDAWVEGDEPCVFIDFSGSALFYAKPKQVDAAGKGQPI